MQEQADILAKAQEWGAEAGFRQAREQERGAAIRQSAFDILYTGWTPGSAENNDLSRCTFPDRFETVHWLGAITADQLATLSAAEEQRQAATAAIQAIMGDGNPCPHTVYRAFTSELEEAFNMSAREQADAAIGGDEGYQAEWDRREAVENAGLLGLEGAEAEAFITKAVADQKEWRQAEREERQQKAAAEDQAVLAKIAAGEIPQPPPLPQGIRPSVWVNLTPQAQEALAAIAD